MQKLFLSLAAVTIVIWPLGAAEQPQPSSSRPHSVSKSSKSKRKAPVGKTAATSTVRPRATAKTAVPAKTRAKTKGKPVGRPVRSYQQTPTLERYQEIQQALAKKGYFRGEANGQWGADSMDALKRFQADQNLTPDGKLNSLSLIAMGLGPKRLTAQSKPSTTSPAQAPQ